MAYRYKALKVHGRRVDEHRYVMEQHLGRYLKTTEIVRHRNGDVRDNRVVNLYIVDRKTQVKEQIKEGKFSYVWSTGEQKEKSGKTTKERYGVKIMICTKSGDELMSVCSINVAQAVAKCSGNLNFKTSDIYITKRFLLKKIA